MNFNFKKEKATKHLKWWRDCLVEELALVDELWVNRHGCHPNWKKSMEGAVKRLDKQLAELGE